MTIERREFFSHCKDSGDEWTGYLCRDANKPSEIFVIIETQSRIGNKFEYRTDETRYGLADYLSSGQRGRGKLEKLIGTLITP